MEARVVTMGEGEEKQKRAQREKRKRRDQSVWITLGRASRGRAVQPLG